MKNVKKLLMLSLVTLLCVLDAHASIATKARIVKPKVSASRCNVIARPHVRTQTSVLPHSEQPNITVELESTDQNQLKERANDLVDGLVRLTAKAVELKNDIEDANVSTEKTLDNIPQTKEEDTTYDDDDYF